VFLEFNYVTSGALSPIALNAFAANSQSIFSSQIPSEIGLTVTQPLHGYDVALSSSAMNLFGLPITAADHQSQQNSQNQFYHIPQEATSPQCLFIPEILCDTAGACSPDCGLLLLPSERPRCHRRRFRGQHNDPTAESPQRVSLLP